jgi:hypothetical protein
VTRGRWQDNILRRGAGRGEALPQEPFDSFSIQPLPGKLLVGLLSSLASRLCFIAALRLSLLSSGLLQFTTQRLKFGGWRPGPLG